MEVVMSLDESRGSQAHRIVAGVAAGNEGRHELDHPAAIARAHIGLDIEKTACNKIRYNVTRYLIRPPPFSHNRGPNIALFGKFRWKFA
jgi:hypothetical protein